VRARILCTNRRTHLSHGTHYTQEVIRQLAHHNAKVRRAALASLSALLQQEGAQFTRKYLSEVLAATITCLSDDDKMVRRSFITVWEELLQSCVSEEDLRPFLPVMMANIRSAASHLHIGCRNDALRFLKVLVAHCSQAICEDHMPAVLKLFDGLLSQV
jgi:pre-rRNA-processing protein IPI1